MDIFFKNYYAGLRHNYYDKYYNYIPYKTRVASTKSEANSRNSPLKNKSRDISPPRFQLNSPLNNINENVVGPSRRDRNLAIQTNPNPRNYQSNNRSQIDEFIDKPFGKARDLSAEPAYKQSSPQNIDNNPYQYVYVPGPNSPTRPNQLQEDNDLKSSIKIEGQPSGISPRLKQNPPRDVIIEQSRSNNVADLGSKPYTFVILNK
jgi:hypothetical protein